jgi:L-rhamnose isomerase/sugar isomerase
VDAEALRGFQAAGDVLSANAVLTDAFATDVRPLLAQVREDMGIDPDPIAAYHRSGWFEKIREERAGGGAAGWGA